MYKTRTKNLKNKKKEPLRPTEELLDFLTKDFKETVNLIKEIMSLKKK